MLSAGSFFQHAMDEAYGSESVPRYQAEVGLQTAQYNGRGVSVLNRAAMEFCD